MRKRLSFELGKMSFYGPSGIVLGYVISSKGIEVGRPKIEIISKLPTPKTIKNTRSFLSHADFYRRFIQNFSSISRPLCNLLNKDVTFEWTHKCQNAFELLIGKLTFAPIM